MRRGFGSVSQDKAARSLWHDAYNRIPKSVFATVAWHLANAMSDAADHEGVAAAAFIEEWRILHKAGYTPQAPIKLDHG